MYLASLTRRVLLQVLPPTCINGISIELPGDWQAYFPVLCVKEECLTRTLGHSYGYWVPREVKGLMQGCPCSRLCLAFAVQREGFQPVDREFQSGLVKAFLRLPPPPLVDVS